MPGQPGGPEVASLVGGWGGGGGGGGCGHIMVLYNPAHQRRLLAIIFSLYFGTFPREATVRSQRSLLARASSQAARCTVVICRAGVAVGGVAGRGGAGRGGAT